MASNLRGRGVQGVAPSYAPLSNQLSLGFLPESLLLSLPYRLTGSEVRFHWSLVSEPVPVPVAQPVRSSPKRLV